MLREKNGIQDDAGQSYSKIKWVGRTKSEAELFAGLFEITFLRRKGTQAVYSGAIKSDVTRRCFLNDFTNCDGIKLIFLIALKFTLHFLKDLRTIYDCLVFIVTP